MSTFGKKIEVHFADQKLKDVFDALAKGRGEEREVYEMILRAIDKLEKDPFIGDTVPRKLIPKEYITKYGIDNLKRYDLNDSWRLIYTIVGSKLLIVSVILEWMPHKEYERRFGYR